MSSFLCKSILFGNYDSVKTVNTNLRKCQRPFSVGSSQHSFTVSYLMDSLGFSQESALSASKLLRFKTSLKADKTLDFFRDFGFTQAQISKLVRAFPLILTLDTEKNILPKLEFFESKGISRPGLAKALSPFPSVLGLSLEKQIVPSFDSLRVLFKSDEQAISAFGKHPNIIVDKFVGRNIQVLKDHGVPSSNIATLLRRQPRCFLLETDRFSEVVQKVDDMGFRATGTNFVMAVFALRSMTRSNWEAKVRLYEQWGWSNEMFSAAFEREPRCMLVSEDKISACMRFVTKEMGWDPEAVVKSPLTVAMSLEKRVVPRCVVYQDLESKGLVKKRVGLCSLLYSSEAKFLQRFVAPFEDRAPKLLELYEDSFFRSCKK